MKTTMIAFAASTAVATAAVKDVSGWVSVTTPAKANSKCYTEAEAPAKEKWTKTSECRKLCGVYPLGSGTVPGTIDGEKCGQQTKPVASGEYPARVKCVGSWQTEYGKCGDEDKDGKRPTCTTGGTAAKTVDNKFKCWNQNKEDFALDADNKCPIGSIIPTTGLAAKLTETELNTAVAAAEAASKTAADLDITGTLKPISYTKRTCEAIPKCAPTMWVQTNACKPCGQAKTTDEDKTYKCVDQKYDEIALVDDKCGDGVLGGAKKTDKQSCTANDACDTYPACPLASGAEKVAMTAAVAIAAIAMF